MSTSLTIAQAQNQDEEFWNFLRSVPLGNSDFQVEHFVFNHCKNNRNYRQAVLEVHDCVTNLMGAQTARKKKEIEIRRLKLKIKKLSEGEITEESQCDIEDAEADIAQKTFELKSQAVMENDAMHRLKILTNILNKLPAYDRKMFEEEEKIYWPTRLKDEAALQLKNGNVQYGHLLSLKQIGQDLNDVIKIAAPNPPPPQLQ